MFGWFTGDPATIRRRKKLLLLTVLMFAALC